ncbi:MAG: HU family DNA-binding protein [Chloroflexi bacterium]|nr:HU family DNA-binding protein [Chloroflexota bacterium]
MVAEKGKITQSKANEVVNAVFDSITETLSRGDEVRIMGFGSFKAAERAARTARNPRTGEMIKVPAQRRPTFSPGTQLTEAVRGQKRKAA